MGGKRHPRVLSERSSSVRMASRRGSGWGQQLAVSGFGFRAAAPQTWGQDPPRPWPGSNASERDGWLVPTVLGFSETSAFTPHLSSAAFLPSEPLSGVSSAAGDRTRQGARKRPGRSTLTLGRCLTRLQAPAGLTWDRLEGRRQLDQQPAWGGDERGQPEASQGPLWTPGVGHGPRP